MSKASPVEVFLEVSGGLAGVVKVKAAGMTSSKQSGMAKAVKTLACRVSGFFAKN
jgi:hypothetical protein